MVGYAFLILRGWLEWVGMVMVDWRFGESAGAGVGEVCLECNTVGE